MVVRLGTFIAHVYRRRPRASREIGRSVRTSLRRAGAVLAHYHNSPERTEELIRALAVIGALLATSVRVRGAGTAASGYHHRRAGAEHVIRDIAAVGALLAPLLRARQSPDRPIENLARCPAGTSG
jgi:hypothetical protein